MDSTPLGTLGLRWPRPDPARPPALQTQLQRRPAGVRLVLTGQLDLRTTSVLKAAVREVLASQEASVVIDLGHLKRLDPAGLAALAEVSDQAHRAGARLAIANLPPAARLWVVRASLHQILELDPR